MDKDAAKDALEHWNHLQSKHFESSKLNMMFNMMVSALCIYYILYSISYQDTNLNNICDQKEDTMWQEMKIHTCVFHSNSMSSGNCAGWRRQGCGTDHGGVCWINCRSHFACLFNFFLCLLIAGYVFADYNVLTTRG